MWYKIAGADRQIRKHSFRLRTAWASVTLFLATLLHLFLVAVKY